MKSSGKYILFICSCFAPMAALAREDQAAASPQEAAHQTQLTVGLEYNQYGAGANPSWPSKVQPFVQLAYTIPKYQATLFVKTMKFAQYGQEDEDLELGVEGYSPALGEYGVAYLYSDVEGFRPQSKLTGHWQSKPVQAHVTSLSYGVEGRWEKYAHTRVVSIKPNVTLDLGSSAKLMLQLSGAKANNSHLNTGFNVRLSNDWSDSISTSINIGKSNEWEGLSKLNIKSASMGLVYRYDSKQTWRLSFEQNRYEGLYRKNSIAFSLSQKF